MLHSAETESRRQLLEMQEDVFLREQAYLDESSRAGQALSLFARISEKYLSVSGMSSMAA